MERKTSQIQRRLGILFKHCHGSLCRKNILIFVPSEHHQFFFEEWTVPGGYSLHQGDERWQNYQKRDFGSRFKKAAGCDHFECFLPRSGNRWIARVDWSSEGLTPRCLTPGDQQKTPFSLSFAAWWKRSHHFSSSIFGRQRGEALTPSWWCLLLGWLSSI